MQPSETHQSTPPTEKRVIMSAGDSIASRRQTSHSTMTLLAADFEPGADDVICGRGKKCYSHIGNENFKKRVEGMLDEYAKAKSKLDKSGVLATVVDQIRAASPNGGFVKQDECGRWFEVGDFLAREKTSQAFRDALHERYKSSNVAKKKRRQEEQAKAHDKFRRIARSFSDDTSRRLDWLSLSEVGGNMGLSASDPRFQMYASGQSFDAAARLSRLAEMRSRLSHRFGVRPPPTVRSSSATTARYPDPLLGPAAGRTVNTMNAFPSQVVSFDSEAYGELDVYDLARKEEGDDEYSEREMMHHSMPNIHMGSSQWNPYEVEVEPPLHHSAPDLLFHQSTGNLKFGETGGDESLSSDMDPIPLDQYTPKPFPKKKIGEDDFKKAISMTLSPTSPSAEAVSRDLIACLEKLTGSSIKDENPFEPLPLEVGTGTLEPLDEDRVTRDKKASPFDERKLSPAPFSQG